MCVFFFPVCNNVATRNLVRIFKCSIFFGRIFHPVGALNGRFSIFVMAFFVIGKPGKKKKKKREYLHINEFRYFRFCCNSVENNRSDPPKNTRSAIKGNSKKQITNNNDSDNHKAIARKSTITIRFSF